jgi:hypothetical protein
MSESTVVTEATSTELVATGNTVRDEIATLASGANTVMSTFKGESLAAKRALLAAKMNSTPLADHVDKPINLANVVVEAVEIADEKTAEVTTQPRITLVDVDGNAFHTISPVIFKDIQDILAIMGQPDTWKDEKGTFSPLPVKMVKVKGKVGQFFTLKLAL